jgi:hypothetical protein
MQYTLSRRVWTKIEKAAMKASERFHAAGAASRATAYTSLAQAIRDGRSTTDVTITFDETDAGNLTELLTFTGINVADAETDDAE